MTVHLFLFAMIQLNVQTDKEKASKRTSQELFIWKSLMSHMYVHVLFAYVLKRQAHCQHYTNVCVHMEECLRLRHQLNWHHIIPSPGMSVKIIVVIIAFHENANRAEGIIIEHFDSATVTVAAALLFAVCEFIGPSVRQLNATCTLINSQRRI